MERGMGPPVQSKYVKGKNYCLVIAIDEYDNGITRLKNCVKDASTISKLLVSNYQFDHERVVFLSNEEATRKNILSALRDMKKKVTENDNLLITFSGHGAVVEDVGYWLAADSIKDEDHTYISSSDLRDRLNVIKCHHLFLIVDACFSGKIFTTVRSDFFGGDEKKPSRYGLSASHSREVAFDGEEGENSPFAKHLIHKLKTNKKPIALSSIASHVIKKVQEETDGRQNPVLRPLNIKGDDLGQYVLHPRHLYFKFDDVLSLANEGKYDEAVTELKNYCLESKRLPKGYEHILCRLKNSYMLCKFAASEKLNISKEVNIDIDFTCQEVVRKVRNIAPKSDGQYVHALNMIGQNKVDLAIDEVKKYIDNDSYAHMEITLFSFRFAKLNKLLKLHVILFEEYFSTYSYMVDLLILLIRNIQENAGLIKNNFYFSEEMILENRLSDSLLLLEDFVLSNFGITEHWYFIKMLKNRNLDVRRMRVLNSEFSESTYVEDNRIRNAHIFLMRSVKKNEMFNPENLSSNSNDSFDGELLWINLKKIIGSGDLFRAIEFLGKVTGGTGSTIFRASLENLKEKELRGLTSEINSVFGEAKLARQVLIYAASLKGIKLFEINNVHNDGEGNIVGQGENYIDRMKDLVAKDEIGLVISNLIKIDSAKKYAPELKLLSVSYKYYEEDKFFTRKDWGLMDRRLNKILLELLEVLNRMEIGLTKEEE